MRVQSLKLLQDILLEKRNVHVMYQYVKSKRQLMLIMNLLRSSSKSIQYEAFHVFKVFVANPKKPRDIRGILIGNREKLLRFLKQLLVDRGELHAPTPLSSSAYLTALLFCCCLYSGSFMEMGNVLLSKFCATHMLYIPLRNPSGFCRNR